MGRWWKAKGIAAGKFVALHREHLVGEDDVSKCLYVSDAFCVM
jgi:hypothetical protein